MNMELSRISTIKNEEQPTFNHRENKLATIPINYVIMEKSSHIHGGQNDFHI